MKKFLNYKTLMTILAGVVVLLEVLMDVFKINLNIEAVISVSVAIVGLMVTLGIVDKDKTDKDVKSREDLKEFTNNEKKDENKTEDENKTLADQKDKTKKLEIEKTENDENLMDKTNMN